MNFRHLDLVTQIAAIRELADRGAIFVVNHSSGKDSQAMYALVSALVPADQIIVVHADLGDVEWAGVKEHIAATVNHDIILTDAIWEDGSSKDLFGIIRDRGMFPGGNARICTSDLKTGPCWKVVKRHISGRDGKTRKAIGEPMQIPGADEKYLVVNCLGLRILESDRRGDGIARKGALHQPKKQNNGSWEAWEWYPIAELSADQVFETIADAGQKPHWAYATGNQRLSCMFCVWGSKNDLRNAARHNPGLYQRYVELEQEIGYTMKQGKTLEEHTGMSVADAYRAKGQLINLTEAAA